MSTGDNLPTGAGSKESLEAFNFDINTFTESIKSYVSSLGRENLVEMISDASYLGFDPDAVIRFLAWRVSSNSDVRLICLVWLVTRGTRVRTDKSKKTKNMARTKSAMQSLNMTDKNARELRSDELSIGRLGAIFPASSI
eukprot:GHVP01057838.1.p1 GENE.GHVP01057838.1~~GHVP01057838.1.p1  ORF type:complete len:140 (-),score=17.89 GHVP01057838.1:348-767(-)